MEVALEDPVLVLNRLYQPLRLTTVREAFCMLYSGRAKALDEELAACDFEGWLHRPVQGLPSIGTSRGRLRVPRILLVREYGRLPLTPCRPTRRHIFLRDGFRCQYCGLRPERKELNIDHVLPRSRGGNSSWENLVASCRRCNFRKGWRTPEECGMRLRRPPSAPNRLTVALLEIAGRMCREWEPFFRHLRP